MKYRWLKQLAISVRSPFTKLSCLGQVQQQAQRLLNQISRTLNSSLDPNILQNCQTDGESFGLTGDDLLNRYRTHSGAE